MIKKCNILCFYLILSIYSISSAQETNTTFINGIEIKPHYGFVLPHHESIGYNISRHIYGFEINTLVNSTRTNWQQMYRNPRLGFGLNLFLIDPEIYGSATGLYSFADVPFIRKNQFSANYRLNLGLAYLNEIFNVDENNFNTAIGSHLNMYFRLGLTTSYRITNKLDATLGLGMTHFSNGNLRSPNLGINIVSANLGVLYKFNESEIELNKHDKHLSPDTKKMEYTLFFSGGARTITDYINDYYFMSTCNLNVERYVNKKRKVGGGLDIFYDGTRTSDEEQDQVFKNLVQLGLHLSSDIIYNRFSLSFQAGYYLYKKNEELWNIYNRLALKYKITNRLIGKIALKSHKIQADYIEWGMGLIL